MKDHELMEDEMQEESSTRRKVLDRFVRISAGVFGALAFRGIAAGEAFAGNWLCCTLAYPNNQCPGNGISYTCSPGYNKYYWWCCYAGRIIGCGECTTGSSCFEGDWECSKGWVTNWPC